MTILPKILTSSPVNKTAALVTGKGTHWTPTTHRNEREWSTPPALKPITGLMLADPNFVNLIGATLGKLTCVGISAEPESALKGGSKWVMRCLCGSYVIRSTRSIKRQGSPGDCCPTCAALRAIRHHQTPEAQRKRKLYEKEES